MTRVVHPPDESSTNHRWTHGPCLVRLRSHPNMTTATIDRPLRSSSTSSPRTRSSRTASKGVVGSCGGGGDSPRGRRRRRRGDDDDVHNDDRIVVRRRPCVVGRAGQRRRRRPSFLRPRPWISSRNNDGRGGSHSGPSATTAPAGNLRPPRCRCRRHRHQRPDDAHPPPGKGVLRRICPCHAVDDDDAPGISTTIHRDRAHCCRRRRALRCLPGGIPTVRPPAPRQQPRRTSAPTAAAGAAFAVATAIAAE